MTQNYTLSYRKWNSFILPPTFFVDSADMKIERVNDDLVGVLISNWRLPRMAEKLVADAFSETLQEAFGRSESSQNLPKSLSLFRHNYGLMPNNHLSYMLTFEGGAVDEKMLTQVREAFQKTMEQHYLTLDGDPIISVAEKGKGLIIESRLNLEALIKAPFVKVFENAGVDFNQSPLFVDKASGTLYFLTPIESLRKIHQQSLPGGEVVMDDFYEDFLSEALLKAHEQMHPEWERPKFQTIVPPSFFLSAEEQAAADAAVIAAENLILSKKYRRIFSRPEGDGRPNFWDVYLQINPEASLSDLLNIRPRPDTLRYEHLDIPEDKKIFEQNAFALEALSRYNEQSDPAADEPRALFDDLTEFVALMHSQLVEEISKNPKVSLLPDGSLQVPIFSVFEALSERKVPDLRFEEVRASAVIDFFNAKTQEEKIALLSQIVREEIQRKSSDWVEKTDIRFVPDAPQEEVYPHGLAQSLEQRHQAQRITVP